MYERSICEFKYSNFLLAWLPILMLRVMKYGKLLKRFASNLSGFAVGDSNQSFHYKEKTIFFKIALGTRLLVVRTCLIMISDYVQARRNRGWEGGGVQLKRLTFYQLTVIVKRKISKKYKLVQILRKQLVTLLLSTLCDAEN